jgi:hypothetical protein
MAVFNTVAAAQCPAANMRQPNSALPTATINPPVSAASPADALLKIKKQRRDQ